MKNPEFESESNDRVPCDKCRRKFHPSRIEVHFKVCKNEKNNSTNINNSSNDVFIKKLQTELENNKEKEYNDKAHKSDKAQTKIIKPTTLVCYLCGKEYGTHSLEIHLKNCKANYIKNSPNKDPENLKPKLLDQIIVDCKTNIINLEQFDEYNKLAEKAYKDETHVACPNCNRKFLPERLEVHSKGCKPKKNSTVLSNDKKTPQQIKNSSEIDNNSNKNSINKSMSITSKPVFLVCFICGREFGKTSLEIHLKSCYNKNEEAKSLPIPPELNAIFTKLSIKEEILTRDIKIYNDVAYNIFKENTMKQCPGCKRRFLPDRLEVHLRSCKSGQSEMEKRNSANLSMTSRPKMQVCPLCGREFGSLSLPIHMKNCKDVFEREQENIPKNKRKSAELIITRYNEAFTNLKISGSYNLENMNKDAYEIWSKEALVPCENCSRTFLPDRLLVHLRSCKNKKDKI